MARLEKILKDWQEHVADTNKLLDEYVSGTDPAHIVEEKERIGELIHGLQTILEELEEDDREIFSLYVFDMKSIRDISLSTGIPRMTVWGRLQRIFSMIRGEMGQSTFSEGIKRDDLIPFSVGYRHENSKHVGFPFELAREQNDGGMWVLNDGYRRYKTLKKCVLKKYLEESFGGEEVACPICRSCKGGKDNTSIRESGKQAAESKTDEAARSTNRRHSRRRPRVPGEEPKREAV